MFLTNLTENILEGTPLNFLLRLLYLAELLILCCSMFSELCKIVHSLSCKRASCI